MTRAAVAARGALALLAGCLATGTVWTLSRGPLLLVWRHLVGQTGRSSAAAAGPASAASPLRFDQVLVAGCGTALLACCLWLLAVVLLLVSEALAGSKDRSARPPVVVQRATDRMCPGSLRRVLGLVLGLVVTVGVAAPASAETGWSHPLRAGSTTRSPAAAGPTSSALAGLRVPDRVAAVPTRSAEPVGTAGPASTGEPTLTVRPGDTLWGLTARLLPDGADAAEISAAWHRVYRRNVARIGADPDLLVPGTVLHLPHDLASRRKEQQ